jgi:3-hydroxyisobutyrate dehydrogenase-like beta-hydroxyacid dehydrogenase
MGSSIARTILKHGYTTIVWNRTPAKCVPLAACGAQIGQSVAEAIRAADVVIINVLDFAASDALLRTDTVAPTLAGKDLVQLTSGSARLAKAEAEWLEPLGARYLDGAIMATPDFIGDPHTAVLYSGDADVFDKHKELLQTLGGATTYIGEVPGQASALDTALLAQMWGGLFGVLQGMAVAQAGDLDLASFETQYKAFKPVVDAALLDLIHRTGASRFAADADTLASLGAHYGAFRHLLEACEDAELEAALPHAMHRYFQQGLATAGPESDFASLAGLFLKSPSAEGDPT